jgi:hypothetical protein
LLKNLSLFIVAAIASPLFALLNLLLMPTAAMLLWSYDKTADATAWCARLLLKHTTE